MIVSKSLRGNYCSLEDYLTPHTHTSILLFGSKQHYTTYSSTQKLRTVRKQIIIILLIGEFSMPALADGHPLEFKTANILKSPGHISVIWPILVIL